jgi:hypothetical protein
MPQPCIVIPGIQGSSLENFYPIDAVTTWSTLTILESKIMAPDFQSLALDTSGRADRSDRVVTRPSELLSIAYAPMVLGLQGRLGVPAYLFPYDWRFSIVDAARELVDYVERLQRKTIADAAWNRKFDFVCHSLGGLVFRAFLGEWMSAHAAPPPAGQVVFIATPHRGSLEAAVALISGETPLFGGRKELRKLARTFPSLYELLPRFSNAIVRAGAALDVFDFNNWQRNTTALDPDKNKFDVVKDRLDSARNVLNALGSPIDARFQLSAANMLVIYGANQGSTLRTVEVQPLPEQWYDFEHATKGDGDDVVPVESARFDGIASVELRADDVSYFRPLQRGYASLDLHAFLPALDEVQTVTSRFLEGARGTDLLARNLDANRYHPA